MAEEPLVVAFPVVLPDNRVVCGQRAYADPFTDLLSSARYVRGLVGDLAPNGVEALKGLIQKAPELQAHIVVAVCPGSRTWDDVLHELLELQDAQAARIRIHVLARRAGPERAANLLWVQPSSGDHGHVVIGNVGNLLTGARWDATDAVLGLPLEPLASDALRRWFDGLVARSQPLNARTAEAPRLTLPEGDAEGRRLWENYILALAGTDASVPAEPVIDPKTGEVQTNEEAAPSKIVFPQPDPVLLAVQAILSKGSVISIDDTSRAPPLNTPVRAELFGERAETRSGAARMRRTFTVSLFDDTIRGRLGSQKTAMTKRLAACSFMLRDGLRWAPDAAQAILDAEVSAVKQEAEAELNAEVGDKGPRDFVEAKLGKIEEDCKALAAEIAPNRPLPKNFVENVKADLIRRLGKNLEHGVAPGISRSRYQIVLTEGGREGPWDQVQRFLETAARLPRDIIAEPRRKSALIADPKALLTAFDVFGDPLIARHLDGGDVSWSAREQLGLIEAILNRPDVLPKQRAHALFALVKGKPREDIEAALKEETAN